MAADEIVKSLNSLENLQAITGNSSRDLLRLLQQIKVPVTIVNIVVEKSGFHTCYYYSDIPLAKKRKKTVAKIEKPKDEGLING